MEEQKNEKRVLSIELGDIDDAFCPVRGMTEVASRFHGW